MHSFYWHFGLELKLWSLICFPMFDSIMDVLQIVITLEIYGVTKIVGIPYGYRGFSDQELTEVPVISCFLPYWVLVYIYFWFNYSIELSFLLMTVYYCIGISFVAVKKSGSEHSSFRWKPIRCFTWRTWSQWNCGQFGGGLLFYS